MKKEYLYAGTSILCWSSVATVTKLLMQDLSPFQVLWLSSLFAGLFLLAVNLFSGNLVTLRQYKLRDYIIIILCNLPGTFLYYVFYYTGAARMDASHAFIINYLWPIMCVVFACIILKEKLTVQKLFAVIVSFGGVCVVSLSKGTAFTADMLIGTVLCTLGAIFYGIFTALNRKIHYDKGLCMMVGYGVTFTLTSLINGFQGALFVPTGLQALGMAWNGMFTMAVAGTLWILALARGGTGRIANLAYITPFLSLVWTAIFLKEPFNPYNFLGLSMIVAGILLQYIRRPRKAGGRL